MHPSLIPLSLLPSSPAPLLHPRLFFPNNLSLPIPIPLSFSFYLPLSLSFSLSRLPPYLILIPRVANFAQVRSANMEYLRKNEILNNASDQQCYLNMYRISTVSTSFITSKLSQYFSSWSFIQIHIVLFLLCQRNILGLFPVYNRYRAEKIRIYLQSMSTYVYYIMYVVLTYMRQMLSQLHLQ